MCNFKAVLANCVPCFHLRFITVWRWCFSPCLHTILILPQGDNESRNRKSIKEYCQVLVFWFFPSSFLFFKTHQRLLIELKILDNRFSFFASLLVSFCLFIKLFLHSYPVNIANNAERKLVFSPPLPSLMNTQTHRYRLLINWSCFHSITKQPSPCYGPGTTVQLGYTELNLCPWSHGAVLAEEPGMERSNYSLA